MDTIDKDIEPYIDERINSNMNLLKKSKKWQTLHHAFYSSFESAIGKLKGTNKKDLEKLYALFNDLSAEEQYLIYKMAFVDGICLSKEVRV